MNGELICPRCGWKGSLGDLDAEETPDGDNGYLCCPQCKLEYRTTINHHGWVDECGDDYASRNASDGSAQDDEIGVSD
jgi:hypothetical protein